MPKASCGQGAPCDGPRSRRYSIGSIDSEFSEVLCSPRVRTDCGPGSILCNGQSSRQGWRARAQPFLIKAGAWLTGGWLCTCAVCEGTFEFHRRVWTRQHGLPHETVRALLQTRDGYLWAGTPAGAARFDGQRFYVVSHADFPVMTSDSCRALAEDAAGTLWIGTEAGLLCWRDGVLTRLGAAEGLVGEQVTSLCPSREGGLWVGTDRGVSHLQNGCWKHYAGRDGLGPGSVLALCEDRTGGLWVGALRWLRHRPASAERFDDFRPTESPDAAGSDGVSAFTLDPEGAVWFGWHQRLIRFDVESGNATAYRGVLPDGRLTTLVPDPTGGLWCAVGSYGVVRFEQGRAQNYLVRSSPNLDDAYCLALDREGNLWIGTQTDGLHCWQQRVLRVLSSQDGLMHDTAWALCESSGGELWIGTETGLNVLQEGRVSLFPRAEHLPNPVIRALAYDGTGGLWIGTGNGLALWRNGQLTTHRFTGYDRQKDNDGKSRNKIRAIVPTRDGAVWVAVPTGLYRLHHGEETFFTAVPGSGGLPHSDVRGLLEGRDGVLWVATAGGGVARLTAGAGSFHGFAVTTFDTTDGLSCNHAWTFHEDGDGTLWIGTERGLNRLVFPATPRDLAPREPAGPGGDPVPRSAASCQQESHPIICSFTTRQGLPSDIVNSILEDDQDRLWVGHDHGIYRVRKQDLEAVAAGRVQAVHCVNYDETDGMLSEEVTGSRNQPASIKTRDGRLWFATAKGIVLVNPRDIQDNAVPPPVVVEQVLADGETVAAEGTAVLRLGPGRGRVLTIRYTANTFVSPSHVRFRHRLEGHDPEWIDNGTQRVAHYTSLRPGRYRFQVIACNAHGYWNRRGAGFTLAIAPFVHQTWWFRSTWGAALLGVGFLCHRWRMDTRRQGEALKRELALAADRERIARDLHDHLGAGLQHISILSELARRQADPGSASSVQLDQIGQTARDSLRTLSQTIWSLESSSASLASVATYLGDFAQRLLSPAGIRCQIEAPSSWPDAALGASARQQLLAAVKESLHNVLKHADATHVQMVFQIGLGTLCIRIEDNGRGFDMVAAQAAVRPPPSELRESGWEGGRGLSNLMERLPEVGGQCRIDSQPGRGTTVALTIPWAPGAGPRPSKPS